MLGRLFYVLAERKRSLLGLIALFNAVSLLELLGIGIIFPYITLISDPGALAGMPQLAGVWDETLGRMDYAHQVLFMSVGLVLVYVVKNVLLFFMQYRIKHYIYGVMKRLRDRLFEKYMFAPYEFHLARNSNVLISNITNEAQRFSMSTVENLLILVSESIFLLFVAVGLFLVKPISILIIALFGLFVFLFYRYTRGRTFEYGRIGTESNAQLMTLASQGILSLRTTKLHHVESYFARRVGAQSQRQLDSSARFYSLLLLPRFTIEILLVTILAGIVSFLVLTGGELALALPILATLGVAATRVMPSIQKVVTSISSVKNTEPTVNIIYDELRTIEQLTEERRDRDLSPVAFEQGIRLDHASFSYTGERPALVDVSIAVKKGQAVGIIGPSGAGKSTLVDVLLGLLRLQQGDILIDGESVRQRMGAWQDMLGYVPQMIYLLDDSVKRNIAFGMEEDEIDEAALQAALRAAELEEVIAELPQGLDTPIGENGVRLSGGQRQRVGIARALYKDPPILILDEATSALDNETERVITEAIDALSQRKTLLIIAHRLTTLKHCDLVYRLDEGRLVASGSYQEMVEAT